MVQERFYQLLGRKLAGEATIQELEELSNMISKNIELEGFAKLFFSSPEIHETDYSDLNAFFAVHAAKVQMTNVDQNSIRPEKSKGYKKTNKRKIILYYSIAAILIFLAGISLVQYVLPTAKEFENNTNEIVSKRGAKSVIKLPDGTKVWLNSDSKLTYSQDFSRNIREVFLVGEGYFDVVKDSLRPFILHTDKVNIRVLGTAFNVKSYPQDDVIETSLIHGKIEVTYKDRPMEKTILRPNEKLLILKNQEIVKASNEALPKMQLRYIIPIQDNIIPETAWVQNQIAFSNETLKNISHMLERRFDVEFEFSDEEVQSYAYTGIFERESLEKIMQLISISRKINYTIKNNKVIISK